MTLGVSLYGQSLLDEVKQMPLCLDKNAIVGPLQILFVTSISRGEGTLAYNIFT